MIESIRPQLALVRGANDVASAVALRLFQAGCAVLLLEVPKPAVSRRGQSFSDAAFDGAATLEGITARLEADGATWFASRPHGIALVINPLPEIVAALRPEVLVDARMRKRSVPEDQRDLAPLVVGLGPNFMAGNNVHVAIETAWGDDLGRVIASGPTSGLAGEPKPIGGYGRERYVYSPVAGRFRTRNAIGDAVREGEVIARIDDMPIAAPKSGALRGLVHDGVEVTRGAKVVEVVPEGAKVFGLGERPDRIAAGVIEAVRRFCRSPAR